MEICRLINHASLQNATDGMLLTYNIFWGGVCDKVSKENEVRNINANMQSRGCVQ